jgi:hypothetical protein
MATPSLEERVATLERIYAGLLASSGNQPAPGAWRKVVGILADDPLVDTFHRDVKKIREEDRAVTRCIDSGAPPEP